MLTDSSQGPYKTTLLDSFFGWCAVWSVNMLLESLPADRRNAEKRKILKRWEDCVKEDFQRQLAEYNTELNSGKVTNTDKLMQAEDFQVEFNRLFGEAKKVAEGALGL